MTALLHAVGAIFSRGKLASLGGVTYDSVRAQRAYSKLSYGAMSAMVPRLWRDQGDRGDRGDRQKSSHLDTSREEDATRTGGFSYL